MSRILVTGGAGYVGSVCAEELLRQGYEVSIVDNLSSGHLHAVPEGAVFHHLDIGDAASMREVLSSASFEAVFHFAAKALIPESLTAPAAFYKVNVAAALTMMDVIREAGIKRFIFSSTAAVYGNPQLVPIPEDHPTRPVNSYGETKLCFEKILDWYSRAYGLNVCVFRYFNAAGATASHGEEHEPETHILPLLFEVAAGERDFFTIYGCDYPTEDGTSVRDYVHVLDIAQAHILALRSMKPQRYSVYNIGLGKGYSVRDIHACVEKVIGRKIPIRNGVPRAGDPGVLCACAERLISELGWVPQYSDMRNIIETAWKWKLICDQEHAAREKGN
ncbi:MAG: UDP-glucose 4-epimerase GalE [Terracidiphilus sp.]|nr:UDP-glucose 4-epimerase GalE [Terracidiphilus sp.]